MDKHLNKAKDYEFFMKRSAYYRNLHHPETKFFQPKNSKGEWILPFDPYKYGQTEDILLRKETDGNIIGMCRKTFRI